VHTLLLSLCVALVVAATAAARPQGTTLDLALQAGGFYTGHPPAAQLAVAGRAALGIRPLRLGDTGRGVAELQLALAWQGLPSGTVDGRFGPRLESALSRFQKTAAIPATGIAGPATLAALRKEPKGSPIPLVWPVLAPLGDGFGPRGDAFMPASTSSPQLEQT
jgi:peptidoglycan hydrolase-like protein with peptidoglycan-binding domain